jgi:uncharacterized phage protein gp47/JayE
MSLTPEGFVRLRLAQIKADYDARFTTALGPINTKPDAVVGQIIGIFSEALDNAFEMLQDNYDAMYPYSAEGTALDGAVSFVGLERLAATQTVVTGVAYGAEGTLIPAGSGARANGIFRSTSDVIISRSAALDIEFEVVTLAANSAYQIILGGNSYAYTTDASPTKSEIILGLLGLIDPALFGASSLNEKLRVFSIDSIAPFTVTLDSKLRITKRGSPIVFVAEETGANPVPVGALNIITSPVAGWDSVSNLAEGDIGRNLETDAELRARHAASVRATGSATVEAIRARMLQEVSGVASIQIYENRTNTQSIDGIPAHAFESVIVGGTNSEVADQLWRTKPAGIETHGNVTVVITDSAGDPQTVKFSRAVPKYIWFKVTVNALNGEELLPIGADDAIKAAIVAYGQKNIGVGDDIILQKFFGPIYGAVAGLGSILIEVAVTNAPTETPVYSTNNVIIGKPEGPIFSSDTITVLGI